MADPQDETPAVLEVHFVYDSPTKNTVKFKEYGPITSDVKIGYLYIQKSALKELGDPERLRVTIVGEDEEPFPPRAIAKA